MSYEIEYRYAAFCFDGQRAYKTFNEIAESQGNKTFYPDYSSENCAVTFLEHGSNNTYSTDNRRARSWGLQHVGKSADVMRRIIESSVYAESGMTQPQNRYQKAEAFIAANRKRLAAAMPLERLFEHVRGATLAFVVHSFNQTKADEHPWWQQAVANGRTYVPRYYDMAQAFRFPVHSIETLECALLTIAEVGDGQCGTMASHGDSTNVSSALDRLCDEKQLELLCG
ncbi:MAG: hypothetical protein ACREPQ_14810 [Rhodanobacter sp.]